MKLLELLKVIRKDEYVMVLDILTKCAVAAGSADFVLRYDAAPDVLEKCVKSVWNAGGTVVIDV